MVQYSLMSQYRITYFPISSGVIEWVSERASERMSAAERARKANSAEEASEWAVRVTEWMSKRGKRKTKKWAIGSVLRSGFLVVMEHSSFELPDRSGVDEIVMQREIPKGDLSVDASTHHKSRNRRIEFETPHVIYNEFTIDICLCTKPPVASSTYALAQNHNHLFCMQLKTGGSVIVIAEKKPKEKKRKKRKDNFRLDKRWCKIFKPKPI